MWTLCVLLVFNNPRDCSAHYPTEKQCWEAGRDWWARAMAWRDRSGAVGKLNIIYTCDPPTGTQKERKNED